MTIPYEIVSLEKGKIKERLLSTLQKSGSIDNHSLSNTHFAYLEEYFAKVNVQTALFESDYIDKDYLEDYARYYAKCFQEYPKRCVRIHFFNQAFDKPWLEKHVNNFHRNPSSNSLNDSYVGFVVIRPIPFTLFGRTCLETWQKGEDDENQFPIIREYKVHLLGMELSVRSLAFQEQDNAVSACATTALWSAFHGTEMLFHHHIPSPYEITHNATRLITDYAKVAFPNNGLLPSQMAHAIKEEGLEPLMTDFISVGYLKAQINAYLRGGIPIIMGMQLCYKNDMHKEEIPKIGDHAVTITGSRIIPHRIQEFRPLENQADTPDIRKMYLYSSKIETIYVHDDQLGPFAEMKFDSDEQSPFMETGWGTFKEMPNEGPVEAKVRMLLIPLYNKIRIRFTSIFNIIYDFNCFCMATWKDKVVWNIYLSTVCELKENFLKIDSSNIQNEERLKILSHRFPRYIWVADAYSHIDGKEKQLFSFYFDATDIENGDLFICALHYKNDSINLLSKEAKEAEKAIEKIVKKIKRNYHSQRIQSFYTPANLENQTKQKIFGYREIYSKEDLAKELERLEKQNSQS